MLRRMVIRGAALRGVDRVGLALDAAAVVGAVVAVGAYLAVAAARLTYPFALEWIEPNSYGHVARVLEGRPLYGPPDFDFIAMIYPPLYFYVSAALAWPLRSIVLAMRLVSVGASLATFALIYAIARARGLPPALGALAVGLYAATYALSGYWFDISRVDSLFLALLLLAYLVALTGSGPSWRRGALAGALLCLAFLAKQQGVVAFPFLGAYLLARREWGKAVGFGAAFLTSLGVTLLAAQLVTGGWFWFYIVTVPGAAPLAPQLVREFWTVHVPALAPAACAMLTCVLLLALGRRKPELLAYLGLVGGLGAPLALMSAMSMAKQYGFINGLMPLSAAVALLAAEAAYSARGAVAHGERAGQGARVASWAITLLLLGQLVGLRYSPDAAVPTAGDRRAGELLLERLASAPEPTFASTAPHLLGALGRPLHFHPSSYGDLLVAARQDEALRERLAPYIAAIDGRLASGAFRSALLPDVRWYDGSFGAEQGYSCADLPAGLRLRTFSGALSTLATLCVRQAPAP